MDYFYVRSSAVSKWTEVEKKAESKHLRHTVHHQSMLSISPFLNGTAIPGTIRSCAISSLIYQVNSSMPKSVL